MKIKYIQGFRPKSCYNISFKKQQRLSQQKRNYIPITDILNEQLVDKIMSSKKKP